SSDYVVFNKEDHAKEALIAADHHQNSKLAVYSLERIIYNRQSLYFIYVDNSLEEDNESTELKLYVLMKANGPIQSQTQKDMKNNDVDFEPIIDRNNVTMALNNFIKIKQFIDKEVFIKRGARLHDILSEILEDLKSCNSISNTLPRPCPII
ncbi:11416_t:CDS:2, partial [Entrophospora sp. SA101]